MGGRGTSRQSECGARCLQMAGRRRRAQVETVTGISRTVYMFRRDVSAWSVMIADLAQETHVDLVGPQR